MASDEIVWQVINQQFCSFKIKLNTKAQTFCRNEYNITGLCSRQSCPLANSRYATVRAGANGTIYLYMKTIERAHLPSKLWERRKLSANYQTALKQIDEWLMYWPKFLQHKAKQRLTRLVQVAIRSRRLAKEEARLGETLVPKMAPKIRRREETRERKAEVAAKLERTIERELLMRLREGAYGDQPLNVSESIWKKVLNAMEREGEASRDKDMDTGIEEEGEEEADYEMEHEEDDGAVEYVSDIEESDEDDDIDDIESWLGSDDDDAAEDSESEDDASEEEAPKKLAIGDKRKRGGPAPRQPKKVARRKGEREREVEYERGRDFAF